MSETRAKEVVEAIRQLIMEMVQIRFRSGYWSYVEGDEYEKRLVQLLMTKE